METETMKDRLLQFVVYLGISKRKFCESVGVSPAYINNLKEYIGNDKLLSILNTYPQLNKVWLLTGEGTMLNEGEEKTKLLTTNPAPNVYEGSVADCGFLGGVGTTISKNSMTKTLTIPEAPTDLVYIRAHGDSMVCNTNSHLSIPDGAYVGIRKRRTNIIQWNEVYAIFTQDGTIIKRLLPGSDEHHIKCISNNTEFQPFEISLTDIIEIAIVVGVVSAVFKSN